MAIRHTWSIWMSALVGVAALVLIPFAGTPWPASATFVPFFLTAVFILEGLTAILMWQHFMADGDVRLLVVACAYAWTALVIFPYAVAFPGLVTDIATSLPDDTAAWLWVMWHVGFPILLAVGLAPWPRRWLASRYITVERRRWASGLALTAQLLLLTGAVLVITQTSWLPQLTKNTDYQRLTQVLGPQIIVINLIAVAVVAAGWRKAHPIERWVLLAVTAAAADATLSLLAEARFTLGWYTGRGANLIASSTLLLAILVETDRIYRAMASQHGSLRSEAATDPLTGSANRRGMQASGNALRSLASTTRTPMAAFQLDIDNFKAINDGFGHATGDDVLIAVAKRLQKIGRAGDVIGRIGGDEFVLIAAGADAVTADAIASRLLESMRQPTLTRSGALTATASIGYAIYIPGESLDDLLARADDALYAAKRGGRDRAFSAGLDSDMTHSRPTGADSSIAEPQEP